MIIREISYQALTRFGLGGGGGGGEGAGGGDKRTEVIDRHARRISEGSEKAVLRYERTNYKESTPSEDLHMRPHGSIPYQANVFLVW